MIIWVMKIFFVQFFCVFLLPFLSISFFCWVHTISVLYQTHLCLKYSIDISNFLEEISSLPQSVVFLYFFTLIAEESFLISPCCSLELCIQMGYTFPFLLCLSHLFFSQLFVRPPQTTILPFCSCFLGDGLGQCVLYSVTNLHPLFFRHSVYQV